MINTKTSQNSINRKSIASLKSDLFSFGINRFKPVFFISFIVGVIALLYLSILNTEMAVSLIAGLILILMGFAVAFVFFLNGSTKKKDIFNRLIISNSSDLFLTFNVREGRFDYVSPSIKALLGYEYTTVWNQYDLSFVHPADRSSLHNLMDHSFIRLNRNFNTTLRMIKRDGTICWMEIKGDVVVDGSNELDHIIMNLRDVTTQKETELAAQQYQKSLEQAIQKNKMNFQDMEELGYLMTSHDLKEPLRTMSSYTRMVQHRYGHKLDNDGQEFLQYAVDAASRMANMMDDILSLSNVSASNVRIRKMHIKKAVEEVQHSLAKKINNQNAQIIFHDLPEIKADFLQVKQLLKNLIENALKYRSQENPVIKIEVSQHTDEWLFKIKDNGIGISEEFHDTIFDVFRRLHSIGKIDGSGIGLAICKKIVKNHGGNIWVESEGEGKGSVFCFSLPVEPEMAEYPGEAFNRKIISGEVSPKEVRFQL